VLSGEDLLEAGWPEGPVIRRLLVASAEYEERGINDPAYILKLLARDFDRPPDKLTLRPEGLAFGEAIEATCPEDEGNVAKVRKHMRELLRNPILESGAIMPDACPAGSSPGTIPVGGVIAARNAIIPGAHSADICCSMYATFFESDQSVTELLEALMDSTRFGYGGRKPDDLVHHPVLDEPVWTNRFLTGLEDKARIHMADQGDGNHFAFLGKIKVTPALRSTLEEAGHDELAASLLPDDMDVERTLQVLVTHHGSRGLGAHLYKRGLNVAIKETAKRAKNIPKQSAWLDATGPDGEQYWEALQYVARWTRANHESIHARFLERTESDAMAAFGNEHNFVWKRGAVFLHGKGATPAWKDETDRPLLGLIPLNMAAPILMVLGRDNEDYLSFAPHGAGRNLSRTAMKRKYRGPKETERAIEEGTKSIEVRWYCGDPDLSETPVAYKPAEQVRAQIEQFELADVVAEIEPLGSIMAGDSGPPPWMSRKEELSPKQIRQIGHRADRRKTRQKLGNQDAWEDQVS